MLRTEKTYMVKRLVTDITKNKLLFDCEVQRGKVWDLEKKSMLIDSLINDYPVPEFYFVKNNDNKIDVLDGKQRATTIYEFVNDEFDLFEHMPEYINEEGEIVNLSEKKFSDLSEEFKDKILGFNLRVNYFDDITEQEIQEMFYRLNNGKPLTNTELTRVRSKSFKQFRELSKHDLMKTCFSDKAIKSYNGENVVMQTWALLYQSNYDFSVREFKNTIINAEVTDIQMEELKIGMDWVLRVVNNINNIINSPIDENSESSKQDEEFKKENKRVLIRIKRKLHLISSIYLAVKCNKSGLDFATFEAMLKQFFNTGNKNASNSSLYNDACSSGSARTHNVSKRVNMLNSILFDVIEKNKNQEVENVAS